MEMNQSTRWARGPPIQLHTHIHTCIPSPKAQTCSDYPALTLLVGFHRVISNLCQIHRIKGTPYEGHLLNTDSRGLQNLRLS